MFPPPCTRHCCCCASVGPLNAPDAGRGVGARADGREANRRKGGGGTSVLVGGVLGRGARALLPPPATSMSWVGGVQGTAAARIRCGPPGSLGSCGPKRPLLTLHIQPLLGPVPLGASAHRSSPPPRPTQNPHPQRALLHTVRGGAGCAVCPLPRSKGCSEPVYGVGVGGVWGACLRPPHPCCARKSHTTHALLNQGGGGVLQERVRSAKGGGMRSRLAIVHRAGG